MIVRYFDISLLDIIKIISVAKFDKRNYPIWNTQNSNNSCKYKFLLSDGLSFLMNKLFFISVRLITKKLKIFLHYFRVTSKHVIPNRGR